MSNNSPVHFNEYGEIVDKGYDGKNKYEYTIFNRQQIEAIELIIQKYNGINTCQNQ